MNEVINSALFLKGNGIPYHLVFHLLEGSLRPLRFSPGQCKIFHDANLTWGGGSDDSEIEKINDLEIRAGELTPPLRELRTMVDFCCIWRYDYPENLLSVCSAIGQTKALPARCHYQIGTERGQELNAYAIALKDWLEKNHVAAADCGSETASEVFRILGTKSRLKEILVERTYLSLINRYFDCSYFGYDASEASVLLSPFTSHQCPKNVQSKIYELESDIIKEMGKAGYNFLGEVGGVEPPCHFKYIRRLLILIGSIGTLKWRGYVPPLDPRMKGRRELTRLCLTALESFFRGKNRVPDTSSDKQQKELFKKIIDLLGKPDILKKWLAFSLYKSIKNQTLYQAYPMRRWVEFVRIKDHYLRNLSV